MPHDVPIASLSRSHLAESPAHYVSAGIRLRTPFRGITTPFRADRRRFGRGVSAAACRCQPMESRGFSAPNHYSISRNHYSISRSERPLRERRGRGPTHVHREVPAPDGKGSFAQKPALLPDSSVLGGKDHTEHEPSTKLLRISSDRGVQPQSHAGRVKSFRRRQITRQDRSFGNVACYLAKLPPSGFTSN